MSKNETPISLSDPDLFSRGSLMFTFDLIRKTNPELALSIRNITSGPSLPKRASQPNNKNSDHFKVELDSFQVRAIVEALRNRILRSRNKHITSGMEVISRTLMEDWIALAKKMFSEHQD
jgi:hypothetical protein